MIRIENEAELSRWLRNHFHNEGIRCLSFENSLNKDLPDLYVVTRRSDIWLELKFMKSFNAKIPFRSGQPAWLDDHTRAGGRAFVVVAVQDHIWVLRAEDCRNLARITLMQAVDNERVIARISLSSPFAWTSTSKALQTGA